MMARGRDERSSYSNANSNFAQGIESLHKCVNYCLNEVDCRRVMLLEYFGEDFTRKQCNGTCDNCQRGGTIAARDFSHEVRSIAAIVKDLEFVKGKRLTETKLIQIFSGSKSKELENYREVIGRHKPAAIPSDILPRLINLMLIKGYLCEENQSNASGFSADYIRKGSIEPCAGSFLEMNIRDMKSTAPSTSASAIVMKTRPVVVKPIDVIDVSDDETWWPKPSYPSGRPKLPPSKSLVSAKSSAPKPRVVADEEEEWLNSSLSKAKKHIANTSSNQTKARSIPLASSKAGGRRRIEEEEDDVDYDADPDFVDTSRSRACDITVGNRHSLDATKREGGSQDVDDKKRAGATLSPKQKLLLVNWLSAYRKRWKSYWNYIGDVQLVEFCDKVPCTLAQLHRIDGLGEKKIENFGVEMLGTVWAFLDANDLCDMFPEAKRPEGLQVLTKTPVHR